MQKTRIDRFSPVRVGSRHGVLTRIHALGKLSQMAYRHLPPCHLRSITAAAWLTAIAALFAVSAQSSVVRCVGKDGRISYQDSSCPNGAAGTPVDATPNRGFQFATKQQIDKAS